MNVCKNALAVMTGMAVGLGMTVGAIAASWDMPTPYPDKTFHTQNIAVFAEDVEKATGGALTIKIPAQA